MSENKSVSRETTENLNGFIDISVQVIAGIAVETAKQVSGVRAVVKLKNDLQSFFSSNGAATVYEDEQQSLSLDLAVVLDYGVSVPNVCFTLQEAIIEQVLYMTDIPLNDVTIHVVNLAVSKELVK